MTQTMSVRIGDHHIWMSVSTAELATFIQTFFLVSGESMDLLPCDLLIHIADGYGEPFVDFKVDVFRHNQRVIYRRKDYLVELDETYREAHVHVWDVYALKHALINLYSVFTVFHNWGLLIHSSCVVDQGRAHLFAGRSGAGKSTVARLSRPRIVLSDEATLVHISKDGVLAYDSPFRSDSIADFASVGYRVASLNLLHQSASVRRDSISPPDAMHRILNSVFYWPVGSADTMQLIRLVQRLVQVVPAYRLYFQQNSSFWEMIY